ncbi:MULTISPECIES: sulfatase family protein [Hungatella]|uniref:sulfatase family protein n=1 Tax=Hungatella TaxID=1649459 RepID=UPI001FAAE64D|nr:sulfatase [Hungatella hathewayi]
MFQLESRGKIKPNIILINCDDLGYGDLGCYGSRVNHTPGIDYMAANGLRMTDFYMASPVCSPSRGAMLTGCYPPRIGFDSFEGEWVLFPGQGVGLNPEETTFAKVLRSVGYRTMLIGKWHCGDQEAFLPLNHGFDEYYGLPYSNDMGRQVHQEENPPLPLLSGNTVIEAQPDQRSLTERYVEKASEFIRKNRDNSFFLYLAHMHVHLPLYAGMEFVNRSENGDYGACVEAIDWSVQRVLYELHACGLSEKTLVVFTSDNGGRGDHGGSNAPLRGKKGTTWEGGLRVPCIFYWPGHIKPDVSSELASSLDFYKTFASLAGAPLQQKRETDSLDLTGLLLKAEKSPREQFFYYLKGDLEAVRDREWKLHVAKGGEEAYSLYHICEDPGECCDVLYRYPEVAKRLYEEVKLCRARLGDTVTGVSGSEIRPIGTVETPQPLTEYDENHPYMVMMYDRDEVG